MCTLTDIFIIFQFCYVIRIAEQTRDHAEHTTTGGIIETIDLFINDIYRWVHEAWVRQRSSVLN